MYMKQVPVSNLVPVNSQKENTNLVEIRLPKKFSALYLQPNLVTSTIYSENLKSDPLVHSDEHFGMDGMCQTKSVIIFI